MSDQSSQTSSGTENNDAPRKYAGKYETVEDLEKAYTNIRQTHSENENLKSELAKLKSAPDEYKLPEGVLLQADDLIDLKAIARTANLSQDHFEKLAGEMSSRAKSRQEKYESRKKELGEEKLNVLHDFVKKVYPANVQDAIINKCIEDNNAMSDILNQRDKLLNSQAPGMNTGNAGASGGNRDAYDGQKEVKELAKEFLKTNDPKVRDRLINVAREVGHERFKAG